jgi:glycosyltransferase involved in cell wall biosynthesis
LDICFTAHKYTSDGHDKGYDIFLEVAKRLAQKYTECRFHVVGGFGPDDLPIDGLDGRITFYGGQTQEWLAQFYLDKDLILLCNVPFIICEGAFDGFPTGCGSDAMLNKLALFCTDPLAMNCEFVDGRDLVIVPHDANAIVEKLSWYRDNPSALRNLAENGKRQAERVYSFQSQLKPRIKILKREMETSFMRAIFSPLRKIAALTR